MINWKVELKLKWTKYCVFSTSGNDNVNNDSNNIIFTIKDTKLCVPVLTLSAKSKQKLYYQNFLAKDLKDQLIGMRIKQKVRVKIR